MSSSSLPSAVPTLIRTFSTHDLGCETTAAASPSHGDSASTDARQDRMEAATPRTVVAPCTPQSSLSTPVAKPTLQVVTGDLPLEGGGCAPCMPEGAARAFDFDSAMLAEVDARFDTLREQLLVFAREQTFSATGLATAAGDLAIKMAATQGSGQAMEGQIELIDSQLNFLKQTRSALNANNSAVTYAVVPQMEAQLCIDGLRKQLQQSVRAQSDLHVRLDHANAEVANLRATTPASAHRSTQPAHYMVNPAAGLWSCLPSVRFK